MNINRDVLIAKLGQLHDAIDRIETKRPPSLELLLADRDLQDIVCKNIERAVQICIDLATHLATMNALAPKTPGESFKMLADKGMLDTALASGMIKAVGFRGDCASAANRKRGPPAFSRRAEIIGFMATCPGINTFAEGIAPRRPPRGTPARKNGRRFATPHGEPKNARPR